MLNLYNSNGLIFWNEKQIALREMMQKYFVSEIKTHLYTLNPAWRIEQVEAPLLTPYEFINKNYTQDDFFQAYNNMEGSLLDGDLILRPETTMGSYEYAKHLLNSHNEQKIRMPLCVWQSGKSFRNEQDQVTKNMRLKEFYQLEFQCIFSPKTANDYYENVLQPLVDSFAGMFGKDNVRMVPSDRLPDYSERTMDIEVNIPGNKWMEMCSISKRKDFEGAIVLEVAMGLDRLVYAFENVN